MNPVHSISNIFSKDATMEDNRGIKRECSPFTKGGHLPDDVKTPPSASSRSSPPTGFPSEVSSRRPCSPVFEQDNTYGKTPMINLSSSLDEKNFIVDTSHDAELTKKLFGDLNRDILGPPGDSKIIILDDSDEENKAQEDKTVGIESTAASTSVDPTSSAPTSTDDAPVGAKIGNSDDQGPDQEADGGDGGGCSTGEP
jgi:hypothetical protein